MKRFTACFFVIAAFFILASQPAYAQSATSPSASRSDQEVMQELLSEVRKLRLAQTDTSANRSRPSQEQVMQELLNEMRQLRVALQRLSLTSYRTQVMVERLRLQQDQIGRLNAELSGVRSKLGEVRAQNSRMQSVMGDVEDKVDSGVSPPSEVNALKSALEEFKKLEQTLVEREIELSNELNTERANLGDLNQRLDALEREMVLTGTGEPAKPAKKSP
jgi:chromosome segregation ATPase